MQRGAVGVSDRGSVSAYVLPFIGREEDRHRLERALLDGTRLLTLVGPSGIGKSRLARTVSEDFRGARVSFCDLAAARSAVDFRAAIAKAVGLRVGEGSNALGRGLQRQGKLLLVLDNAEYVVKEAAEVIENWLGECPKLQILATSLEPLALPGETRMTLGPLDPADAVALYQDRARRAGGRLTTDRIAIEALVEKLDRIPLAIELAAARAHVLPPSQFLGRIGQRFQLLQGGRPGRHGSLEQAIACSWELLREDEKVAVAQISVFMGGFTLDAAEAVLDCGPDAAPVLEILASLVSKGLLAHDGGAPPRFAPYESLREYARERLFEMGQVEETTRRHAAHFLQLGEAQAENYENAVDAQERLDRERDNLLAAHRRSLESDPGVAARIGLALWRSYTRQGTFEAELLLLNETIAAARRAKERKVLARALVARARARIRLGRIAEGREDVEEALAIADAVKDPEAKILALLELGASASFNGEEDEAEKAYLAARAMAERLDNNALAAAACNGLGVVEFYRGNVEGAVPHFSNGVALARLAGNEVREASCASNLGHAYTVLGDLDGARAQLENVLEVSRRRDDEAVQGAALVNLANVATTEGSLDEALGYLEEGLPMVQRTGATRLEGAGLATLGQIAMERLDYLTAKARLRESAQILRDCGDGRLLSQVWTLMSLAHVLSGTQERARETLEECEGMQGDTDPSLSAAQEIVRALIRVSEERLFGKARGERAEKEALRLLEKIAARGLRRTDVLVQSKRLARRYLGEAVDGSPSQLSVGPEGAFFRVGRGPSISLRSRRPLRLLLLALVERRLEAPGCGMGVEELARTAWPGEAILPRAAANRVYNAVRALRKMGLDDALQRQEDGYLLSPTLDVVWAGEA